MRNIFKIDVRLEGTANHFITFYYNDGSKLETYGFDESTRYGDTDEFIHNHDKWFSETCRMIVEMSEQFLYHEFDSVELEFDVKPDTKGLLFMIVKEQHFDTDGNLVG